VVIAVQHKRWLPADIPRRGCWCRIQRVRAIRDHRFSDHSLWVMDYELELAR